MDPVIESLKQIKVKEIKIFISKKDILPGFPERGLWPIITLSLGNKEKSISFRNEYLSRKFTGGYIMSVSSKIRIAVLRLIGKNKSTKFDRNTRVYELENTINKIVRAINTKLKRSAIGKNAGKARQKAIRQNFVLNVKNMLRDSINREKIKYNEIRSYEIAKLWDELMVELAVKEVHNK